MDTIRSLFLLIFAIFSQCEKTKIVPLQDLNTRIFSGTNATVGQFPFQAALYVTSSSAEHYFCSGTLITHKHILTAGQCTVLAVSIVVYLGFVDISDEKKQIYESVNITTHPAYSANPIIYDIGVIELDQSVTFSDRIKPIRLSYDPIDANLSVIIAGYGQHNVDEVVAFLNNLQYATLETITNEDCGKSYETSIFSDIVCAKGPNKESICKGDVGGPLLLKTDSEYVQVGIASFRGDPGCTFGYPVGFTRISAQLSFIETYASSTSNIRISFILEIFCITILLYLNKK